VGGIKTTRVDVRLIAATNRDLQAEIEAGRFRKDLYYRLAVVRVHLPPLRDRVDDVGLLAELFLARCSERNGGKPRRLSPQAVRLLVSHEWPGNIRELQNVIERAALMSSAEEIGPADILLEDDELDWQAQTEETLPYDAAKQQVLERFQRRYVERLLARCSGNVAAAAREAQLTRAALHRIIKRLGLSAGEEVSAEEA
jgi:DNA-binding NtrC family response regulator